MSSPSSNISIEGLSENGFVLPNGYSWDVKLQNGMKEGKVTVRNKMSISTGNELISLLNDSYKRMSVSELVIERGCGNELRIDLWLCGFEYLKKLIVKKNSLKNLNSLVISNNSKLESIEIEDGQEYDIIFDTCYAPFENMKSVEISSIF